jgi:hypothetical protein
MHEVRMQEAYQSEESAFLNLSRSFITVLCGYSWAILIIGFTYFNEGIPNLIKFSFDSEYFFLNVVVRHSNNSP